MRQPLKRPTPQPDIVEFITDPKFLNLSLSLAQETCLRAIYCLPMTQEQLDIYHQCTGRSSLPSGPFSEATIISGARGGQDSRIAAPVVCYEALFGNHSEHLSPGESGTIVLVAQDAKATRIAFSYIRSYLTNSALLRSQVQQVLASEIILTNGITISCFPCTLSSLRGWSIPVAVMDEVSFFSAEGAADSDSEVQQSIRRGMINFPQTKLVKISTPFAKAGILYSDFQRSYGKPDDDLLVWRAPSLLMNPTLRTSRLDQQQRLDPQRFAREYLAEFVDDLEAYLSRSWIDSCVARNVHARAPRPDEFLYYGAIDASGGGSDAFTLTVVHIEGNGHDAKVVVDFCKGWTKTRSQSLDLESVVAEIVTILKGFMIEAVLSDRYGAGWVKQSFARHGITLVDAPTKSDAFVELEPLIAQGSLVLLDDPQLVRELSLLEKHNRPGGRVFIDHPSHGHDDKAASLALAVYSACQYPPNDDDDPDLGILGVPSGGVFSDDEIRGNSLRGW